MSDLFSPLKLGSLRLNNRIIMAPMTRSRALTDGTPTPIMVDYYRQRASAGMIITEGVYPSENGKGYCRTPGMVTTQHQKAWKTIVDAVKAEGGSIVMQLMHCGRVAHADNKAAGTETVAPSAIAANAHIFTEQGMQAMATPRELRLDEIPDVIADYCRAAEMAFDVGFDGVELHATSGYLPAQFLSTGTNHREDCYGGSVINRVRFVDECLQALARVNGADRVGLRICPGNPFNDLQDENALETFEVLLDVIAPLKLAYLHAIKSPANIDVVQLAQNHFKGPLIINDGFDQQSANDMIKRGEAAAVSFGRHFIANPDLPERFQHGWPLSQFDGATLYTPGAQGYSDYPVYTADN